MTKAQKIWLWAVAAICIFMMAISLLLAAPLFSLAFFAGAGALVFMLLGGRGGQPEIDKSAMESLAVQYEAIVAAYQPKDDQFYGEVLQELNPYVEDGTITQEIGATIVGDAAERNFATFLGFHNIDSTYQIILDAARHAGLSTSFSEYVRLRQKAVEINFPLRFVRIVSEFPNGEN